MDYFDGLDTRIAYRVAGGGEPVLMLVHGFASTHRVNWVETGWEEALAGAGFRVVMPDLRGHGASGRPHDAQAYEADRLTGDLLGLMDHLGFGAAAVMGYSLGAAVALRFAAAFPARCRAVVAAGVGDRLLGPMPDPAPVLRALAAEDPATITDPVGLAFRRFADANGQDLKALAACYAQARAPLSSALLRRIEAPAMVVTGENDDVAGDPVPLAAAIGPTGAQSAIVPRRDHMRTVGDKVYKQGVLDFLGRLDLFA